MTLLKFNHNDQAYAPASISSIFSPFFLNDGYKNVVKAARDYHVPYDVFENKESLIIELAIPGIKREDLDINLENEVLIIKGERKKHETNENQKYRRINTNYGKFEQQFKLTQEIVKEDIDAKFEDGILYVTLPKAQEVNKVEKISIK